MEVGNNGCIKVRGFTLQIIFSFAPVSFGGGNMMRVNYKIRLDLYPLSHQSEHPKWLSSTAPLETSPNSLIQQDDPEMKVYRDGKGCTV